MDNQEWQRCIDVLDAFYRALGDGNFEGAYEHLSLRDKRHLTLEQFSASRDGDYPPSSWNISPSRKVERHIIRDSQNTETLEIAYLNVKLFGTKVERRIIRDSQNTETLEIVYRNVEPFGTYAPFEARMIKENGEWKVYHQSDIPRHVWMETSNDGAVETWRIP